MKVSIAAVGWSLLVWSLVVTQTGCASAGRRLVPKIARQVQPGMSRLQVEKLLGPPQNREKIPDGRELVVHVYRVSEESFRHDLLVDFPDKRLGTYVFGGNLNWRMLTILYGRNGPVERVTYSDTRTPYFVEVDQLVDAARRQWVGTEIAPAILGSIQKGVTTSAELELKLGEPTWRSFRPEGPEMFGWYFELLIGRNIPRARSHTLVAVLNEAKVVVDFALVEGTKLSPGASSR